MSEDASVERLSVGEAAKRLGITRDAVHKRINRGTIRHKKGEDGRLYVYVDASTDESKDEYKANPEVEVMERYIARLERDLEEAQVRDRENRRIIAALTQRIPAIEAPESPESPVPTPTEAAPGTQEADTRPWWRFW